MTEPWNLWCSHGHHSHGTRASRAGECSVACSGCWGDGGAETHSHFPEHHLHPRGPWNTCPLVGFGRIWSTQRGKGSLPAGEATPPGCWQPPLSPALTCNTSTPMCVTARLICVPSPSLAGCGRIPYISSFLATSSS